VASTFVLFHQRRCGPLANSLFHHKPQKTVTPPAKIEAACRKADAAIQKLVELIAAYRRPESPRPLLRDQIQARQLIAKADR
jgi:hypothetical protein